MLLFPFFFHECFHTQGVNFKYLQIGSYFRSLKTGFGYWKTENSFPLQAHSTSFISHILCLTIFSRVCKLVLMFIFLEKQALSQNSPQSDVRCQHCPPSVHLQSPAAAPPHFSKILHFIKGPVPRCSPAPPPFPKWSCTPPFLLHHRTPNEAPPSRKRTPSLIAKSRWSRTSLFDLRFHTRSDASRGEMQPSS